jgi:hypothetical protein
VVVVNNGVDDGVTGAKYGRVSTFVPTDRTRDLQQAEGFVPRVSC